MATSSSEGTSRGENHPDSAEVLSSLCKCEYTICVDGIRRDVEKRIA